MTDSKGSSSSEDEADCKLLKAEEAVASSSSEGGNGSSGAGYSADISDQSSEETRKKDTKKLSGENKASSVEMCQRISIDRDKPSIKEQSGSVFIVASAKQGVPQAMEKAILRQFYEKKPIRSSGLSSTPEGSNETEVRGRSQTNGVHISHPMDSRINLSCVGYGEAAMASHSRHENPSSSYNQGDSLTVQQQPRIAADNCNNQYSELFEAVRPFFHAHVAGDSISGEKREESIQSIQQEDTAIQSTQSSEAVSEKLVVDADRAQGSSSEQSDEVLMVPRALRVVTDVSSSNNGNATSNVGTSGSGSGGNSGSNQGSSGSGNEEKGSNEKKGHNSLIDTATEERTKVRLNVDEEGKEASGASSSSREQKLLMKKRKRIYMRQEYEHQQDYSSSTSNWDPVSLQLQRPPLTMDQAIMFSNFARYVVFLK